MPVQPTPNGQIPTQTIVPIGAGYKPEESFTDDFIKLRKQKAAEVMAASTFGGGATNQSDVLATTIVTKALDNLSKSEERYVHDSQLSREDAQKAGALVIQAREDLHKAQMDAMNRMIERLEKAGESNTKGAAPPKTLADTIRDAQELVTLISGARGEAQMTRQPAATDVSTQISILKMQQDHEIAMKKIDLEMTKMKQEADIKMLEFQDNRVNKKQEYEDSRNFKENAITQLSDIAKAAAASVSGEMAAAGGDAVTSHAAAAPKSPAAKPAPTQQDVQYEATLLSFPCKSCQTEIPVPPEGGVLTCTDCGAKYKVDQKQ